MRMKPSGRITLNFPSLPEQITIRQIKDEFLIGVGTTDKRDGSGCTPVEILYQFRASGINYFLPFTHWSSIETREGDYSGDPCPGEDFIRQAARSGCVLNGHGLVVLRDNDPNVVPSKIPQMLPEFVIGRPFEEQRNMIEKYIRATMRRFPEIEMWGIGEPVWHNGLGCSLEQNYEVFVAASKWIHQVNPNAKVMISMLPVSCQRPAFYHEPKKVMDDLMTKGLEADVIGVELFYDDARYQHWADMSELDKNGFPTMEWVKNKIKLFSNYKLPIILSETSVSGRMYGKDLWDEQADWLEQYFKVCHDERGVIGATWYFIRDRDVLPYGGLMNDDFSFRPAGERLLKLVNDWNPAYIHQLEGKDFVDLEPGKYDIVIDKSTFRVAVSAGESVTLSGGGK